MNLAQYGAFRVILARRQLGNKQTLSETFFPTFLFFFPCFYSSPLSSTWLRSFSAVGPHRATNSTALYFSNMGSSQPLYSAEWSARYTWEISPSALCHLLPLTEPYVSELRLIHLSAALISIAAAKEVFHSRKAHWGVECLHSGWDWTLVAAGFCAASNHQNHKAEPESGKCRLRSWENKHKKQNVAL